VRKPIKNTGQEKSFLAKNKTKHLLKHSTIATIFLFMREYQAITLLPDIFK
jgi:hypothetical protein